MCFVQNKKKNSLFIVLSLVAALLLPRSVSVGLKSCTYPPGLCAHGTVSRVLQVIIIYYSFHSSGYRSSILTMAKKSASKIKQDNTTQIILVNRYNKQGNFREWSSLSYTPIKAYCTAVLGCRDRLRVEGKGRIGIRYCTIGCFQIVILRMASVSMLVGWEVRVSSVERVSSVGVTNVSSLVMLRLGMRWFVLRFFLVFCLCVLGLFHRRYK